jgi:hypothetical protein
VSTLKARVWQASPGRWHYFVYRRLDNGTAKHVVSGIRDNWRKAYDSALQRVRERALADWYETWPRQEWSA